MKKLLNALTFGAWYWWLMIASAVLSELLALFYQYVLDYGPCPLCIHARAGVAGYLLISVSALIVSNLNWRRICFLLNSVMLGWLIERSYFLLGTERGFTLTECGVDAGFPSWLPLDKWIPAVFEPLESCGYTPLLPLGVSMAEAMIVVYPLMLAGTLLLLVLSFTSRQP